MLDERAGFSRQNTFGGRHYYASVHASGMRTNHAQQRQPFQDGEHEFRAVFGPGLIEFAIV